MTKTATIILAAGAGRRMGGVAKALLKLPQQKNSSQKTHPEGGGTQALGLRAVDVALRAGTSPVLILGYEAREVERVLRVAEPQLMSRSTVIRVDDWEKGLSASFRDGVQAATRAGFQRCAVLLVDQPGIGEDALVRVLAGHQPGRITRGAVAQRPSHPVVFDVADALAAAESAVAAEGARSYLAKHWQRVDLVEITAVAQDADLDTPEDLRRFQS